MKAKAIELHGWTFSRLETGDIMVEKEPLVANKRLLSAGEWDGIVASLWVPREDTETDEYPEDGPEDEPF